MAEPRQDRDADLGRVSIPPTCSGRRGRRRGGAWRRRRAGLRRVYGRRRTGRDHREYRHRDDTPRMTRELLHGNSPESGLIRGTRRWGRATASCANRGMVCAVIPRRARSVTRKSVTALPLRTVHLLLDFVRARGVEPRALAMLVRPVANLAARGGATARQRRRRERLEGGRARASRSRRRSPDAVRRSRARARRLGPPGEPGGRVSSGG